MNTPTPEQVEDYQRDGFLRIANFLDAQALETWRRVTDDAVRERLAAAPPEDSYYARVFIQCERLADTHAEMARLVRDERLGEIAGSLAGVDRIRVWHDQALIKQPFGNATSFHLDDPFWSFSSRQAISVWIALDDATPENGCLWYLPGTQTTARFELTPIGQNFGALFDQYPEWRELEPVAVPARAGDAVFHNGLIAHAAGVNLTPRPRRAMTVAFMPDGATYNGRPSSLHPDYVAGLAAGDPLDDDRYLPLTWQR
jgi:ectoine hydroxylase-related dioxygenase (phytanoyl-CoA dioxygenase family)